MTVEVRPYGVSCNLACQYCYQNPQRETGNRQAQYDLSKIISALDKQRDAFSLFGGEPLLMPIDDLEVLFAYGKRRFGRNSIQTNGALISAEHIALFKRQSVSVGISVDGPGALNDARWAGTLAKTRAATAKTESAIERLCMAGLTPSLIVTLHRGNATGANLDAMCDWLRYLSSIGVRHVRLHTLEVETEAVDAKYSLSAEEAVGAITRISGFTASNTQIRIDMLRDIRALLCGEDNRTTCVWRACDPYTTAAVSGIEGQGQASNCGRTNKEGIDFVKSRAEGFERYLALFSTPQADGGCEGCRFFVFCKGQCPGGAIDSDWRNRSSHCEIWKELFELVEQDLLSRNRTPLSLSPERAKIERKFCDEWSRGANPRLVDIVGRIREEESE